MTDIPYKPPPPLALPPNFAASIASYFHPTIQKRVSDHMNRYRQHHPTTSSMAWQIYQNEVEGRFLQLKPPRELHARFAADKAELIEYCSCAFSKPYVSTQRKRLRWLERMLSKEVVDEFVKKVRLQDWLEYMIEAIVRKHLREEEERPLGTRSNARWILGCLKRRRSVKLDTASSTPPPEPFTDPVPEPKPATHCPQPKIEQIVLKGKDLRSAWLSHIFYHLDLAFNLDAGWTPAEAGGSLTRYRYQPARSFHSVSMTNGSEFDLRTHFDRPEIARAELDACCTHQTSFSATRALLWAVFKQELVKAELVHRAGDLLNHAWTSDNKTDQEYRGVLLLQYKSTITSQLRSLTLSESEVDQWAEACEYWFGCHYDGEHWFEDNFVRIRGDKGAEFRKWPNVIYAPELASTRKALHSWTGENLMRDPMWRSAYCTEAAGDFLKRNIEKAYAISFEQTKEKRSTKRRMLEWTQSKLEVAADALRLKIEYPVLEE